MTGTAFAILAMFFICGSVRKKLQSTVAFDYPVVTSGFSRPPAPHRSYSVYISGEPGRSVTPRQDEDEASQRCSSPSHHLLAYNCWGFVLAHIKRITLAITYILETSAQLSMVHVC